MKKFLFTLLTITAFFMTSAEARGVKITIPVDNNVHEITTLPDSSYYQTDEDVHLDLGYIEKDGSRILVLFSKSKPDTYYDIPEGYTELIQKDLNVEDLGSLIPKPSFWDRWGGSILFYILGGLIILGILIYVKEFIFNLFGLGKKNKKDN